jgi:uncharacterized protein (DUF302 family)
VKNLLIRVRSGKPLKEVLSRLAEAAPERKFSVTASHDLQERIVSKGLHFERPLHVVELCNASAAKKVLDTNLHIATVLPCRVAVYREEHETVLETLKPTLLVRMFDEPTLELLAGEMEKVITEIMEAAAK